MFGLRRGWLKLVVGILGLGVFFLGGWLFLHRVNLFPLEEVRFEGLKRVSEAELRQILPVERGTNLFRVNLKEVKRVLERHPWVASVEVSRDLPHTLKIYVQEEDPIALVVLSGKLYFVDPRGKVFARAPRKALFDYPVVNVEKPSLLQKEADFLRLMAWVRDKDIYLPCYESFSQIYLGSDRIILYTKDGLRIRFDPEPLAQLKADYRRLDRIMTYLYQEGLYRKAAAIRLDYPGNTALLAYREEPKR